MSPSDPVAPARWQRIKELYQAAVERPPAERAAFLSEACGADEALRREIERLLRQDSGESPLDRPAWDAFAALADGLSADARWGPYEVLERIGGGGMGEVYKARDTRLDRIVALKMLRGALSDAPEFRRRLEREARATSALSHPNVCTLYDVGEQAGTLYLVMEYVDGVTLAARLGRGALPFEQVLAFGAQVAGALAAAHARGIVHRDLKPANVMISRASGASSMVKVLDFGLAKVEKPGGDPAVAAETLTGSHTLVGTLAYMAPEQLEGEAADSRTDIYALGLLLYEMATGRKPFEAKSEAGLIAEMLRGEPHPLEGVPPRFQSLVMRCLARDPGRRWQSAADVQLELEDARRHAGTGAAPRAASARWARAQRRWILICGAPVVLALAFAAGAFFGGPETADQSQYRFTPFAFASPSNNPIWSPDGNTVAYCGYDGAGVRQVFLRRIGAETSVQVTRLPEGAIPAGWSKDSRRILLRSPGKPGGIWSVAAVGGEPESVLALDFDITAFAWNGDDAALTCPDRDQRWGICISAPLGSPLKRYSPEPFATRKVINQPDLHFSPDGRSLLYILDDFVSKTRQAWLLPYPASIGNPPKRVLPKAPGYSSSLLSFSWEPDGSHIVFAPGTAGQLWEADVVSGRQRLLFTRSGSVTHPEVSPDGRRIVFDEGSRNIDIVSASLDGSPPARLIATDRMEAEPAWAAHWPVLGYLTDRSGPEEIWIRTGDGDRPVVTPRDFSAETFGFMAPALSPDGDRIVYKRLGRDSSRLWISAVTGGALIPLTNEASLVFEYPGSWSPDGNWFVYTRGESAELMKVRTTGQAAPQVLKSNVADGIPSWSPTGEWIAHGEELISPDGQRIHPLGKHGSSYYMFSADGKLVYGIRQEGVRVLLFSVEISSNAETIVGDLGAEFRPACNRLPGIRFSLAPDGRSFVYAVGKGSINLWLLEAFNPRTGLLSRFGRR